MWCAAPVQSLPQPVAVAIAPPAAVAAFQPLSLPPSASLPDALRLDLATASSKLASALAAPLELVDTPSQVCWGGGGVSTFFFSSGDPQLGGGCVPGHLLRCVVTVFGSRCVIAGFVSTACLVDCRLRLLCANSRSEILWRWIAKASTWIVVASCVWWLLRLRKRGTCLNSCRDVFLLLVFLFQKICF